MVAPNADEGERTRLSGRFTRRRFILGLAGGLVGVPHLVFLNSEGEMLPDLTRQEYVGADELLNILEQVQ